MSDERLQELWDLPDAVNALYQLAFEAEVRFHVLDAFQFDTLTLKPHDLLKLLLAIERTTYRSRVSLGRATRRTFATFASRRKGKLGVPPGLLSEWLGGPEPLPPD